MRIMKGPRTRENLNLLLKFQEKYELMKSQLARLIGVTPTGLSGWIRAGTAPVEACQILQKLENKEQKKPGHIKALVMVNGSGKPGPKAKPRGAPKGKRSYPSKPHLVVFTIVARGTDAQDLETMLKRFGGLQCSAQEINL